MKKGQIDHPILLFAVLVIGLMFFGPIMMKAFLSIKEPFSTALSNISQGGTEGAAAFNAVMTPLVTFWDKVMISAFFTSVFLLLISAFFIDTHPLFVVVYIFICFMLAIFLPSILTAVDNIYDHAAFLEEVTYLPMLDALRTHFATILLGIMILTGIIIYAKIAYFPAGGGSR